MERPALFVGDAEEGAATLKESEVRQRMKQGIPPESAEEYLLRVRIESKDLPAVVEAHVPEVLKKKQTLYMPSTEPVPSCPAYMLPSEEWERGVVSTFVDLRQYLRRWKAKAASQAAVPAEREAVPALKDATGWHIFCLGFTEDDDDDDDEVVESEVGSASATASAEASQRSPPVAPPAAGVEGARDPRHDDDAQSSFCANPVESSSRFDKFAATLEKTLEESSPQPSVITSTATAEAIPTTASPTWVSTPTAAGQAGDVGTGAPGAVGGGGGVVSTVEGGKTEAESTQGYGGEGEADAAEAVAAAAASKRATGRDWLETHPRGTPPTMRLALQFDQVLTQRVLAFHADWLRDNLLSRARAVWIYTLLACLEKPLGSETAALVREVLRRCCAQRSEVESPEDDNLPALNVIIAIAGRFFQQAEAG
ncbi:unnamed protein product [Scytosiphon promiscuus]